jgi:hypothetical protein
MNLFTYTQGGIYQIVCAQNKKIYYGQTQCFLRRCYQHFNLLKDHKHSCFELQKDFLRFGLDAFKFEILLYEKDFKKRLKLEKSLLQKAKTKCLYNPIQTHNFKLKPRVAQRVKIHGKIYISISEASRILNQSKRNIGLKLNDRSNINYQRLNYHQNTYFDTYKVKVKDTIFESTRAVVEVGLAKNTRQVRDRCRSKKWKSWQLIKKRSNDYSAKK